MIVDKLHDTFSVKHNKWLRKHISFNTQKRSASISELEKDFYKFFNNAFRGKWKTLEAEKNQID